MPNDISRRNFIAGSVAASTAYQCGSSAPTEAPPPEAASMALPTRVLGRTGERPSILALGCGSRLTAYDDEANGIEAINLAIDNGITYLDTAQAYGNGKSETWVGKVMKDRRKEVFLATKIRVRGYDEAMAETERSLERLQTDHLDLIHIHNLWDDEDLAKVEEGSLKVLYKLRDEKVTRFIGVTSHTFPDTLAKALERHDFDCTQMALNAALQGRSKEGENLPPVPEMSFERIALPVANKKNIGVIAMKVTAQENIVGSGDGKAGIEELLQYALSLPVSVAVVGMPKLEHITQNTTLARGFTPMAPERMREISTRLAEQNKVAIDYHFCYEHEDV